MTNNKLLILDSVMENHFDEPDVEAEVLGDVAQVELEKVSASGEVSPERLERADAVILWHCLPFAAAQLDRLHRCKAFVKAAVGYDNIDIAHAHERGIPVFNTPDYGTEDIADHAMSLILALERRLIAADQHVKQGHWEWAITKPTSRLRGKTLGIIGFGRIGRALAARAQPFGFKTVFYDPYVASGLDKSHAVGRCEELNELLAAADVISIHASLTESSNGLLNQDAFRKMKPGVTLVNTARGAIVETRAMVDALRDGRVRFAGLDVLDAEPSIPDELRNMPQVLFTPHSAFYSEEGLMDLRRNSALLVRNILLNKQVRNLVSSPSADTLFQLDVWQRTYQQHGRMMTP